MSSAAFEKRDFIPVEGNPFGLVYGGAITENIEGAVNIHAIKYPYRDFYEVANVYTPADYGPAGGYPAVVMAHPNGGMKDQVAGNYAQKLAENGYIAFAFDTAYQGESGGEPRCLDYPANCVEDIHRACDIIMQYPGVNRDRAAALGICGVGGYAFKAAQTDKHLKVAATLSLFSSGEVRCEGFRGSQVDSIQEGLAAACQVRQDAAEGQAPTLTPNMCETATPEQADAIPYDLYREGYCYYGRDAAKAGGTFRYTVSSLMEFAAWDAHQGAELINVPLLMTMGSRADTGYMTIDCYEAAVNAPVREIFEIPGATHIQTYRKPEYVR